MWRSNVLVSTATVFHLFSCRKHKTRDLLKTFLSKATTSISCWWYVFLHRIKALHMMKLVSAPDLRFFFAESKLVHRMDLESQWSRMSSHTYRVWSPSGFKCLGIVPMSQASLSSINVWSCKLWESFHLRHGSLRIGQRWRWGTTAKETDQVQSFHLHFVPIWVPLKLW